MSRTEWIKKYGDILFSDESKKETYLISLALVHVWTKEMFLSAPRNALVDEIRKRVRELEAALETAMGELE